MGSKVKKVLGSLAPLAGFIPGVGIPLAAAIGAGGGLLAGGGLKGALGGALGGAGAAGLGGSLGSALTGTSNAASKALGGALVGGAGGGISGGLNGALLGASTGGLGGYLSGSGGLGSALGMANGGGAADDAFNKFLSGSGTASAANKLAGEGNGVFGLGKVFGAGQGAGSSSFNVGDALGAFNTYGAQDDIEEQLMKAQGKALEQYTPYTQTGQAANSQLAGMLGLDPNADKAAITDSLRNTPGYQFRLSEGQKALERSQAARGGLFSGQALKASQEYGQGLADQTYNNYIQQLQQQSGQGLNAAGGAADLIGTGGSIQANATANRTNAINEGLSSAFGGGLQGAGKVRYDKYGNPYYI